MINLKAFIITSLLTITTGMSSEPSYDLPTSYNEFQQYIIAEEEYQATGGSLNLTQNETEVNDIFLKYKREELEEGFRYSNKNVAGMHFFKAKHLIDKSKVFRFLKKMPKGALLHTHALASVSSEWVVKNIFYMPGLLRCVNKDGLNILTFRNDPVKHDCATEYSSINEERENATSQRLYDLALERLINLHRFYPETKYSSANIVWTKLQNAIKTLSDVLLYEPAYRAYSMQMWEELYQDNIMYAEVRLNLNQQFYDSNGAIIPMEHFIIVLFESEYNFKLLHPDFLGIRIIYAANRNAEPEVIRNEFAIFERMNSFQNEYVIGFDLVGREDQGKPLKSFFNILHNKPNSTNYFFHAGETNSYGAYADLNLLDAFLLKSKRIGHGYSLMKHPLIWNNISTSGMAVEVCPISNQVLNLVSDLRNHPGAAFISSGIPIVIGNDSPGFWNAKALSYDFFYAIMSLAPENGGLKLLKNLVWNSIKYSTMSEDNKVIAYDLLKLKWDYFIDDVLFESSKQKLL